MTDCSELERRDFEKLVRDLEEQVKCLQKCLASRDDFLCDHGMFGLYLIHLKEGEKVEPSKVHPGWAAHEERVAKEITGKVNALGDVLKTYIPSRPAKGGDL